MVRETCGEPGPHMPLSLRGAPSLVIRSGQPRGLSANRCFKRTQSSKCRSETTQSGFHRKGGVCLSVQTRGGGGGGRDGGREVTAWGPRLPPSLAQLPLPTVGPFALHRWAGSWFLCWGSPPVPVLLSQLLGGTEDGNTNHLQNFRAGTGRKPQRAFH